MDIKNRAVQEWVTALRSGKYQQGQHFLRAGNYYCCLGVACELYSEHLNKRKASFQKGAITVDVVCYDRAIRVLPEKVQTWLGLASATGVYLLKGGVLTSLAMDNDTDKSFAEIADIIESNPEGLFADYGEETRIWI